MNEKTEKNWQDNWQDSTEKVGFDYPSGSSDMNWVRSADIYYQQFLGWFGNLPQIGQIGVLLAAALGALMLLRIVVQLISLAISLVLLGGLGFIGYKLLMASKSVK
jgi:hypothetical protein